MLYAAVASKPFLRRTLPSSLPWDGVTAKRVMGLTFRLHGSKRMTSQFRIVEHVVRGQHVREYPAATANGDGDSPVLAVKQYIPLSNPKPRPDDVTIIAAHANGFPKEMYEPLWDEIEQRCHQRGFRIRSIWIADLWNQGQSGVLNENILGDDASWFDHSRDLLYLINQKQDLMPQPLIGIGHSVGATQLAYLSLLHPRLLKSLALLEPGIQKHNPGIVPAVLSTRRRDVWPSRESAAESFKKSKFYQSWDPRVLDLWIQHGLREVPTALIGATDERDGVKDGSVMLTTTKHQELFMYTRPTYRGDAQLAPQDDKVNYADFDPNAPKDYQEYPFYRPEPAYVFEHLPEIRPNVLYIFGRNSEFERSKDFTPADGWELKISRTGVGVGGGGGTKFGQVKKAVISDSTHLVAFEKVQESAEHITEFIGSELEQWRKRAEDFQKKRTQKSPVERATIDEKWVNAVDPNRTTPVSNVGRKGLL